MGGGRIRMAATHRYIRNHNHQGPNTHKGAYTLINFPLYALSSNTLKIVYDELQEQIKTIDKNITAANKTEHIKWLAQINQALADIQLQTLVRDDLNKLLNQVETL
jgi:hypothetical protein